MPPRTRYTVQQLEGRALEHAFVLLAQHRACPAAAHCRIRMKDSEGRWSPLTSKEDHRVPKIFARMYDRAVEVRNGLRQHKWNILGAGSPVRLEGEPKPKSVDLRLAGGEDQVALVELKWSRKSHRTGLSNAPDSYAWLRRAAFEGAGTWLWGPRGAAEGAFVGGLGVAKDRWVACANLAHPALMQ